ncbi:MAG: BamA/TamA family outer membrane protein [Planctomycetota bacterium]|nr:BamA/TamA family outer membrane protein [Planctomycetota bacterium]MDG1986235.1 BamA/TamA family outer membrane protein [Planctomycetota bacterium]
MRLVQLLPLLVSGVLGLAGSAAARQEIDVPKLTELAADRPIVMDVMTSGLTAHDADQVVARLGIKVGQPIPQQISRAQKQLWDDFRILVAQGGYLFEEVEGGVRVRLRFIESPVDLDPRFVGNNKFDVARLREWGQLDDRVEVYVDEAEKIAERIRTAYRRQGYYFIEVEPRIGGDGGVRYREIIFEIREGPKVYVKDVEVVGDDSIPDAGFLFWKQSVEKSAALGTKGRGLFAWWGHRLVEEVVEADVVAISQVYRDNGYLDAVVGYDLEFTEDRSGVRVKFNVDAGELYRVSRVNLRAVSKEMVEVTPGGRREAEYQDVELSIDESELRSLLSLESGGAYEAVRVALDAQSLRDRYGEEGHIDSGSFDDPTQTSGWTFLAPELVYNVDNKTVEVTYLIQEGRKFFLRYLEVEGNETTKDHVIRRRFAQLEGERVDSKELRDGLRRVRATGYFDDQYAQGAHPPPALLFRPVEGEPDLVDAVVQVKEGRTINANLSGGVASDQGLVGIISLQVNNFDAKKLPSSALGTFGEVYRKEAFTGNDETFGVDLSPGSEVSYWRVFYQHPDFLQRYFDPLGLLFEIQARDRIYRSHDETRRFFRAALTRAFGQGDFQASVGFRTQSIRTQDLATGVELPRTLVNSEGTEDYVGLTASVSANMLDNRRLPRSGWSGRWNNTIYTQSLGSDVNLWKSEVSLDKYFHLSGDLLSAAPGIYLGFGGGLAVPFDEQEGSVNYGERFFYGGSRFGRGFRFRGVGPYEGAYPLGGETFLRATGEYRVPLYTQPVPGSSRRRELFRGSLFVDAGVLDPEAYQVNFDEARVSAGFALGMIEPFPVTFSFGWPIKSEAEDETQTFAFTLTLR